MCIMNQTKERKTNKKKKLKRFLFAQNIFYACFVIEAYIFRMETQNHFLTLKQSTDQTIKIKDTNEKIWYSRMAYIHIVEVGWRRYTLMQKK